MRQNDHLFCRKISWNGRPGYQLGNGLIRLVTLAGGGHIAEFRFEDASGRPTLSPLWIPPWKTIDAHRYRPKIHAARYGPPTKGGKLLSGIVGHNICLDYFGIPSAEEYNLGLSDHGEAPIAEWHKTASYASAEKVSLVLSAKLPEAGLELRREIRLRQGESVVYFKETVKNQRKIDHFFHWVQHVTLGPPFLRNQEAALLIPGTRGKTSPYGYDEGKALLAPDREFRWPLAPTLRGGTVNLGRAFLRKGLGFVVGVLLDPRRDVEYIAAVNPRERLLIGYAFRRSDYPWVTVWEENDAIAAAPWRRRTQARGLEFGTTPFAPPRRDAFQMGSVFGTPTLCCVPARGQKTVSYVAFLGHLREISRNVRDIKVGKREIIVVDSTSKSLMHVPASGLDQTGLFSASRN